MVNSNENPYKQLSMIINDSQNSVVGHPKLLTKCQQMYHQSNPENFFADFTRMIEAVLTNMTKNPNIERIIDFIAKFAVSLTVKTNAPTTPTDQNETNKTLTESSSMDEIENHFLVELIKYLLKNTKANSDAVRYRCCQLLAKLMGAMNNDQFIDEELFDEMCDAMLERLKDISSRVQVQAINAIHRLQDPNDRQCRVIKALLFLMNYDPNWQVRFQALSNIAFSKNTLPHIIERVKDVHATVRRKALMILSEKVLIKFISIERRLFILNYSLKDIDEGVVDTCCKKLLPSWLTVKENNVVKLLKALDVVEASELMTLMLDKMYRDDSVEALIKDFTYLNEKHLIDLDKLDAESVFYWKWLCEKCAPKSVNNDDEKATDDANDKAAALGDDECLDMLLPSVTEFCEYFKSVFAKITSEDMDQIGVRREIENLFTLKQLIKMFAYLDFSDMHGKKSLINLCHELFRNKDLSFLYETVMEAYKLVVPNLQQRVNNLVELISDIKDPSAALNDDAEAANITEPAQQQNLSGENMDVSVPQPAAVPKQTPREISLKISELKFQKFKLKEEFDNLYKDMRNIEKQVDVNKLAELRQQIKQIDDEIAQLLESQKSAENIQLSRRDDLSAVEASAHHESTHENQKTMANNELDESAILDNYYQCLQLSVCMLEDIDVKQLLPQLRSLCDNLILQNISSVDEKIRQMAVRALNLTCILKIDIAQKYIPLFINVIQHDKKDVMIEAFKSIINCIMAFSLNKLLANSDDVNESTTKVLSTLTSMLDHEDQDVVCCAVEGFCKLFMTGHIVSAKLFSKIMLMYYSPLTENDKRLRACLASFLPQYSFMRSTNQICVEESFMTTVKCLLNAPPDSHLAEIDQNKVIETLLHLTNPKNLFKKQNQRQQVIQNMCHENICKAICYEILKEDNAFKLRSYVKILNLFDLSNADYYSLKEINKLSEEVEAHISDKLLKKVVTKYKEGIHEMLVKKPEYKNDQNKEQETSTQEQDETVVNRDGVRKSMLEKSVLKNSSAHNTSSLNSSDIAVDFDFVKIKKKAKNKDSTLKNTTVNETNKTMNTTTRRSADNSTSRDASKTPIKDCTVILQRVSLDSTAVRSSPRNSKRNSIRSDDTTNNETDDSTPTRRITRSFSRTPQADNTVIKATTKENVANGKAVKTRSKASKSPANARTQSQSPAYEPPSKVRKSSRIPQRGTSNGKK